MFGPIFDGVFAAILIILTIIFLMGKGEKILQFFNGNRKLQNKKRTEEEKNKIYVIKLINVAYIYG